MTRHIEAKVKLEIEAKAKLKTETNETLDIQKLAVETWSAEEERVAFDSVAGKSFFYCHKD